MRRPLPRLSRSASCAQIHCDSPPLLSSVPHALAKIHPPRDPGAAHVHSLASRENGTARLPAASSEPHTMLQAPPLESHSMPHQPADIPVDPSESHSKPRGNTRSAIACARCRHSKTKCINNSDQKTPCIACSKSNKPCEWNHDKSTASVKTDPSRRNSAAADFPDGGVSLVPSPSLRIATTPCTTRIEG